MKIVSINVPSLLVLLVGKSTTCDRLYVFIKVRSFDAALIFARRDKRYSTGVAERLNVRHFYQRHTKEIHTAIIYLKNM
jgi:hypothetical protein